MAGDVLVADGVAAGAVTGALGFPDGAAASGRRRGPRWPQPASAVASASASHSTAARRGRAGVATLVCIGRIIGAASPDVWWLPTRQAISTAGAINRLEPCLTPLPAH